jgi:hypothetical protein
MMVADGGAERRGAMVMAANVVLVAVFGSIDLRCRSALSHSAP